MEIQKVHNEISNRHSYGLKQLWEELDELPRVNSADRARYQALQAWRGLATSPITTVVTTLTIAVTLFLLGVFMVVVENFSYSIEQSQKELQLTLYVRDGAAAQAVKDLIKELTPRAGVGSVNFVTKADALAEFGEVLGDERELLTGLESDNPLPASIELVFQDVKSAQTFFKDATAEFSDHPVVEFVQYSRGLLDRLSELLGRMQTLGTIGIALILLMTGFIISNTIQLALYARRSEIEIMQLVGATDWFVRIPFLIEGGVQGLVGAGLGLILLVILHGGIESFLRGVDIFQFVDLQLAFIPFWAVLFIIVLGVGVGVGGSYVAVRRFSLQR